MEEMFEKLNALIKSKVIDLKDFYIINIWNNKIQLQGDMNRDRISRLRTIFGEPVVTNNSWIVMSHDDVEITLT